MGGKEGSRGYLYQAVTAVIGALVEENWNRIYVEFPTSNDKVDIALANDDNIITAIQVKSSINPFERSELIKWTTEIVNDIEAESYQIYIIGQCAPITIKFINSIEKFYDNNLEYNKLDEVAKEALKTFDLDILCSNKIHITQLNYNQDSLLANVRDKLHRYISGKDYKIHFDVLETLSESIVMTKMLLSTNGNYISKDELDNKIFRWVSLGAGHALQHSRGFSTHKVGIYDLEQKAIFTEINPISIDTWLPYHLFYAEIKESSRELISKIDKIPISTQSDEELLAAERARRERSKRIIHKYLSTDGKKECRFHGKNADRQFVPIDNSEFQEAFKTFCDRHQSIISEEDKNKIIQQANSFLEITITDDFFNLGNLQEENSFLGGTQLIGNEDEKLKYSLIHELLYVFLTLDVLALYLNTFEDIILVPIALCNDSSYSDEDVTVSLLPDKKSATPIQPEDFPIYKEIEGLEGMIHDFSFVEKLLKLPCDANINIQVENIQCIPQSFIMPRFDGFGRAIEPESTKENYISDLIEYIATSDSNSSFSFHFNSIHAGEKKWVDKIILLKVKAFPVVLKYVIKSKNSDGSLNGKIVIK